MEKKIPLSILNQYKEYIENPYFKAVFTLAQRKSHQVFFNAGKENAIAVLSNIFISSEKEVCLFTENSKPDVSNDQFYTRIVEEYINKGKRLFIIVKNDINPDNCFSFYKAVYDASKREDSNVKWKVANDEVLNAIAARFEGQCFNFAIGDERSIRIETDTNNYRAICSFNESVISKALAQLVRNYCN